MSKIAKLLVLIAVLLAMIALLVHKNPEHCSQLYHDDITVKVGATNRVIHSELAETEQLREKGLGGRECIGKDQAMLFVFNAPAYYGIWMKDMSFTIDVIWLNASKKVVFIVPRMQPASYPKIYTPTDPTQYILELHENSAEDMGIKLGTQLSW